MSSEYARSGVNYVLIEPFKEAMINTGKRTLSFPNRRGVFINEDVLHAHGAVYKYRGRGKNFFSRFVSRVSGHLLCQTQEGLGNKNWIAEWMYQFAKNGKTYYDGIGIDAAMLIVNDVIAQGAMPVVYTDEVAAGDSEWFNDKKRTADLAESYYRICELTGMAMPAGESPALRYLVKAELPVKSAPTMSGCVTGIIAPASNLITGRELQAGDSIIGVTSSGLHANGVSLVIKRALALPDQFLTRLPNCKTLGDEALIPTRSYVALVESLLNRGIHPHALLPGTGDGVGKIAFDKRPFSYRIHSWPRVPIIFQFMRELGVSLEDCLKTFNWGVGYYLFVAPEDVDAVIRIGDLTGYELLEVGVVEEGDRKVIFEPEDIVLPPPGQ